MEARKKTMAGKGFWYLSGEECYGIGEILFILLAVGCLVCTLIWLFDEASVDQTTFATGAYVTGAIAMYKIIRDHHVRHTNCQARMTQIIKKLENDYSGTIQDIEDKAHGSAHERKKLIRKKIADYHSLVTEVEAHYAGGRAVWIPREGKE